MQAACSQLPVSEIGTRVRINEFYSSSDRGIGTVLDGKGFAMHRFVTVRWDDGSSSCENVAQLRVVG